LIVTPDDNPHMERRIYLGALATLGGVGVAGCSEIGEFIASSGLRDVNVISTVAEPTTIYLRIDSPAGEPVLDETPSFSSGEEDVHYEDVWQTTGEHTTRADPDDGPAVTATTTIESPDDSLIVSYNADGFEIGKPDELG